MLGFPFIFRGALDVHAKQINEEMKVAAARALAALAHEDVPDSVLQAYGVSSIKFGREYLIPKPLDPRVLLWESPAVAEAAMKSGVARKNIDLEEYREQLRGAAGDRVNAVRRFIMNKAKAAPKQNRVRRRRRIKDHSCRRADRRRRHRQTDLARSR